MFIRQEGALPGGTMHQTQHVGQMLGAMPDQRRRQLANIESALGQGFSGTIIIVCCISVCIVKAPPSQGV